jgi:hypothetical protein
MAPVLTRTQKAVAVALFGVFMVAAALAPFALIAAVHAGNTADGAQHNSRVNAAVAAKGQDFASTAAKACQTPAGRAQLQRLGINCAQASQVATTPPTGAAGPQGVPGIPGPGPSLASVEQAVAAYCDRTTCGTGPTAAQVAQAVATFCHVDGRCQGPAGPSGAAGTSVTGPPGPAGETVTGPAGTNGTAGQDATSDQVAAAVSDYCTAHDGCKGDTGTQGPAGPAGPAGPPGPTCTTGYSLTQQTVRTAQGPVVVEMCTADDQTSPAPVPSSGGN